MSGTNGGPVTELAPRYGLGIVGGVVAGTAVGSVVPAGQNRFTTLLVGVGPVNGGRAPIDAVAFTGTRLFRYGSPVSLALLAVIVFVGGGVGFAAVLQKESGGWNSRRGGIAGGSRNGTVFAAAIEVVGVLCGVVPV